MLGRLVVFSKTEFQKDFWRADVEGWGPRPSNESQAEASAAAHLRDLQLATGMQHFEP